MLEKINKELKELKLDEKSLQEQKEIILHLLSEGLKTDEDLHLIHKATKKIFEAYSEYDSIIREYIEKIFINPEPTNDILSFAQHYRYIDAIGHSWDNGYEEF